MILRGDFEWLHRHIFHALHQTQSRAIALNVNWAATTARIDWRQQRTSSMTTILPSVRIALHQPLCIIIFITICCSYLSGLASLACSATYGSFLTTVSLVVSGGVMLPWLMSSRDPFWPGWHHCLLVIVMTQFAALIGAACLLYVGSHNSGQMSLMILCLLCPLWVLGETMGRFRPSYPQSLSTALGMPLSPLIYI